MSHIIFVRNGHGYGHVPYRPVLTLGRRYPAIFDHVWSAIRRTGKAFSDRIAQARRRARAYDQLAAMSDPELHDIGISRADIPAVVWGTYRSTRDPIYDPTSSGPRGCP